MRAAVLAASVVVIGGCSKLLGISDLSGPSEHTDAGPPPDAPIPVPFDVTGLLNVSDPATSMQHPLQTTVDLLHLDGTVYASTTSDAADGSFTLTVHQAPLDVALHIHGEPTSTAVDYVLYLPPLVAGLAFGSLTVINQASLDATLDAYNGSHAAGDSVFFVSLMTSQNQLIDGVTLASSLADAKVIYLNTMGVADPTLTATSKTGNAILLTHTAGASTLTLSGSVTRTIAFEVIANAFGSLNLRSAP